jgi:FkbM family methyltransferase
MKILFVRIANKFFGNLFRQYYGVPSMQSSFQNMLKLGFRPNFIIDIGAFDGEWTDMASKQFSNARFLMLEAQEKKRPVLEGLKRNSRELIDYRIAVMGANEGEELVFHEYENSPTASSMLQDHAMTSTRKIACSVRTLDSILASDGFPKPDLIKLDVQGYELEVLKGAKKALSDAEVVMMEVSIIEVYQQCPVLSHVIAFMAEQDFRAYDICSLVRRPLDNALCQVDIIFIKENSELLDHKVWC